MTPIRARYHDGKTAWQRNVQISPLTPHRLLVTGDDLHLELDLSAIRVSSRIGNTPRQLRFPDGSQCECDDNDAIDALFASQRAQGFDRLLHRWESRLGPMAAVVLLAAALLWAGFNWGVPALAREIAFRLPATMNQTIGRGALAELDRSLLGPSKLGGERRARLQALFAGMVAGLGAAADYRLELRDGRHIGANALALPSGIVILTDQLVELAQSDAELSSVLAHEIGHVEQRHALRGILQASAVPLVLVVVTGDLGAVLSMASVLPTVLVQQKFSRDFEREADDFAFDQLRRLAIPTQAFPTMLRRLDQQRGSGSGVTAYLSTHPATEDRIARFGSGR